MASAPEYAAFYERLGAEYPESEEVHGTDPRRRDFLLAILRPFAERGVPLLDVGCNDGVYTIPYAWMGGTAHGIDISPSLVEKARRKAGGARVTFETADIEEYTTAARYGVVFMSEVIEHVRRPDRAIANAVAALAPGGSFVLSTPNANAYVPTGRYLLELLRGRELVAPVTVDTTHGVLGEKWGLSGYRYRHDAYYPFALRTWLCGYGLRSDRLFTFGMSGYQRPFRVVLKGIESAMDAHRIPVVNLFGMTCVAVMHKP